MRVYGLTWCVLLAGAWNCLACGYALPPAHAEAPTGLYRAINLNGPALEIDGRRWEAGNSAGVECREAAFENQMVRLQPPTDTNRARMIRSSRWSSLGRAQVAIAGLPEGKYSVYLYVWEDNDSQTFDIRLNGRLVAERVVSGAAGHWQRLGPWTLDVVQGRLEVEATGGHANLSGLEVWHGKLGPQDNPLPAAATMSPAAVPAPQTLDSQVAILLARHCLECHNAADRKGGLDLTRREPALGASDSGQVLIPGNPDGSELLRRVEAGEMPPEGREPLGQDERVALRRWVTAGAKWAADPIDPFLYTSDRRAGYNWWSLQPLRDVTPPAVADTDWVVNPIDHFILDRLNQAGLTPAPAADRRTLIRRLSYDLLGLPPAPEDVEAFVNDPDPQAYSRLVDRLLDSPHYGERWARHWLDLVRFGESQGFERNKFRPSAWKYRDFVVEAFNADLPYDQFIRWQLAGDVLRPHDPLAVVASGFLVVGPYDLTAYNNGTPDMRAFAREEELEGLVATVCQTFLALTVNCARCHDHKFDPVTQREFYRLSAALGGTYHGDERECVPAEARDEVEQQAAAWRSRLEQIDRQGASAGQPLGRELAAMRSRAEAVLRLLEAGPVHTTAPRQPGPWRVLARGDFRHPGEVVTPGGVAALVGVSADWQLGAEADEAERRKALAGWIADPRNPLTPRVIVNRLWGWYFGQGLVATPSDFGFQGGQPSHPELLDWLAGQLVHPAEGPAWSLKRIQRLIVESATYRQASRVGGAALAVDAENRLLWRYAPRRLEAETYRDAVLAISGQLDRQLGGPGFRDYTVSSAGNNETYSVFDAVGPEFQRRSLYRTNVRSGTSPLLDALDCPDPSVATPRRTVTSTPLQALTLLNNKFMQYQSERFAERLRRDEQADIAARIRRAYALAFARFPDDEELAFGQRYIDQHGLAEYCLVLLNANEFLFVH
ncbi:MAG: PSD1 domain-containing protein [Pirellulaceae bacterium]|nr:PSD1 domain-containing protein [Pirellulaceae bacterium]